MHRGRPAWRKRRHRRPACHPTVAAGREPTRRANFAANPRSGRQRRDAARQRLGHAQQCHQRACAPRPGLQKRRAANQSRRHARHHLRRRDHVHAEAEHAPRRGRVRLSGGRHRQCRHIQRRARHRGLRRRRGRPYRQYEDRYADLVTGHSRHHRPCRSAGGRRRRRPGLHQALSRRRRPGRPDRSFRPRRRAARHPVARRHRLCGAAGSGRALHRSAIADFGARSRARPRRSCARRLRRGPWAARSISSAPPCSSSNAISCGPINPISNGRASCRDASNGPDCSSSGPSCGPCPADSRCRRPARPHTTTRRAAQQQPGAPPTQQQPGARPNLQPQPGAVPPGWSTECADIAAAARRAADTAAAARSARRVRNARPPGSASRRRKTKAVSARTSWYACCQSGRRRRTPRGLCR